MEASDKKVFRAWKVKNTGDEKKYHTAHGSTDFDIPMFGYKSAFLILSVTFGVILLVPWICCWIGIDYRPVTAVFGGLCSGFSVSYSQFFIERDKGICPSFWVVGSLMSLFSGLIIMILVYTGWLL